MFPNLFGINTPPISLKMYALQWPASCCGVGSVGRASMLSFHHFSLSVDPTNAFSGGTRPIYYPHICSQSKMLGQ